MGRSDRRRRSPYRAEIGPRTHVSGRIIDDLRPEEPARRGRPRSSDARHVSWRSRCPRTCSKASPKSIPIRRGPWYGCSTACAAWHFRHRRHAAAGYRRSLENGHSPIMVDPKLVNNLPRVATIPIDDKRAFLALEGIGGRRHLELAVLDRLEAPGLRIAERTHWWRSGKSSRPGRTDPSLAFEAPSIIVVGRQRRSRTGFARQRATSGVLPGAVPCRRAAGVAHAPLAPVAPPVPRQETLPRRLGRGKAHSERTIPVKYAPVRTGYRRHDNHKHLHIKALRLQTEATRQRGGFRRPLALIVL